MRLALLAAVLVATTLVSTLPRLAGTTQGDVDADGESDGTDPFPLDPALRADPIGGAALADWPAAPT